MTPPEQTAREIVEALTAGCDGRGPFVSPEQLAENITAALDERERTARNDALEEVRCIARGAFAKTTPGSAEWHHTANIADAIRALKREV